MSDDQRNNVMDLSEQETNRRSFLKYLGVAGTGLVGLRNAIGEVSGDEPNGVPLIYTTDRRGNPDKVRMVSKERYRRLKKFENLDLTSFRGNDYINGLTLEDRDGELRFKAYVNRRKLSTTKSLKSRFTQIPIEYEHREKDPKPMNERRMVCNSRERTFFEDIEGNIGVDAGEPGTLGLVAWSGNGYNSYTCLITANHVAEDDSGNVANKIKQSGYIHDGEYITDPEKRNIGTFVSNSEYANQTSGLGMDAAKYRFDPHHSMEDTVSAISLDTKESRQPDISGKWTFAGLSDATSSGEVPTTYAGHQTCYSEGACTNTERNDRFLDYVAKIEPSLIVDGDSGGPYVDENGKFVAMASFSVGSYDDAAMGEKVLQSVDAQLYPSIFNPWERDR